MKTPITRIALLSSVALGTLLAQGGGAPPDPAAVVQMRVQRLTRMLGLTEAQASQATTIFTNAQTATTSLYASLNIARTELNTAVKANNVNNITTQATAIGNLTGQTLAIRSKADAAFYAILTPEQQSKFEEFGGAGFGRGGPGGPGGPGEPGMGPIEGPGPRRGRRRD